MMTDLQLWNLTASVDRGLHTFGLSWVIGRGGRSRGERPDSDSGRLVREALIYAEQVKY